MNIENVWQFLIFHLFFYFILFYLFIFICLFIFFQVIIAAHAPPGYFERFAKIPFFPPEYNGAYVDFLNEFGDVLMAQIYGHEHTDSFKLFTTKSGNSQIISCGATSV